MSERQKIALSRMIIETSSNWICTGHAKNLKISMMYVYFNCKKVEQLLYNFVKDNENTTGYFQGLNFVAQYVCVLMNEPIWSISLLKYIGEYIFNVVLCYKELLQFCEVQEW